MQIGNSIYTRLPYHIRASLVSNVLVLKIWIIHKDWLLVHPEVALVPLKMTPVLFPLPQLLGGADHADPLPELRLQYDGEFNGISRGLAHW